MIPFHLYGLVIGIAVVIALELTERGLKKFARPPIDQASFLSLSLITILGGLVGARLWHVMSDFHFYRDNLVGIVQIWTGGLSILGAIVGGILAMWWWLRLKKQLNQFGNLLDALALALPFAQAFGRLGNYLNQELYGLKSDVAWAIEIAGVRHHPLFAYEALAMLSLGGWLWYVARKVKFGKGNLFLIYLSSYCFIRFLLDFLRVDKAIWEGTNLGFNQVILLIVMVGLVKIFWGEWKNFNIKIIKQLVFGLSIFFLFVVWMLSTSLGSQNLFPQQSSSPSVSVKFSDHQIVGFQVGSEKFNVEVVNSATSITQGLSGRSSIDQSSEDRVEGMLFIFSSAETRQFWMVDMNFDLDLIWINAGKVVGITENVPHPSPGAVHDQLPRYESPGPVDQVLELYAGMANQYGITVGMDGMITPDKNE